MSSWDFKHNFQIFLKTYNLYRDKIENLFKSSVTYTYIHMILAINKIHVNQHWNVWIKKTSFTYHDKLLLYKAITLCCKSVLEKHLQPWVKKKKEVIWFHSYTCIYHWHMQFSKTLKGGRNSSELFHCYLQQFPSRFHFTILKHSGMTYIYIIHNKSIK